MSKYAVTDHAFIAGRADCIRCHQIADAHDPSIQRPSGDFDVMSSGRHLLVSVDIETARLFAVDYTSGYGVTQGVIATIFNNSQIKPGEITRPVEMYEFGVSIHVPNPR